MGCKAQCAANSPAIGKQCNAADRPKRHLPFGLGRHKRGRVCAPIGAAARRTADRLCGRAIWQPNPLHGHMPMRRGVGRQLIPIASQRDPK
jgi:hypothetical protein